MAIADVAVGQEKELVLGDVEGRLLSKRDYFGLVPFDDLRTAVAFSLLLGYPLIYVVEFSLFDLFRGELGNHLNGITSRRT